MKAVFYRNETNREKALAGALHRCLPMYGDEFEDRPLSIYCGPTADTDCVFVFGVKGKRVFMDHRSVSIPVVVLDKGYVGPTGTRSRSAYFKASVNASQPTAYFQREPRPRDRWKRLRLEFKRPKRPKSKQHIIVALSSQKYADWHGLGDANGYAKEILIRVSRWGRGRPILYRPKPTWDGAEPIWETMHGVSHSGRKERMENILDDAYALVTHGSGAAIDALLEGVPVFQIGDGITLPMANRSLKDLSCPWFPSNEELIQWGRDMAFCQWRVPEIAKGGMWPILRAEIWRQFEEAL